VNRSPAIAKTVYEGGHWIGLHGYDRSFPHPPADLKQSLQTASRDFPSVLCASMNIRTSDNGLFTWTLDLLHQWQYRPVMTLSQTGFDLRFIVVQRVLQQVQNGSQLLHDGACGQDVAATTAQLVACYNKVINL